MSIKGLFSDFRDYLSMRPEDEVRDFVDGFDWFLNERNVPPKSVSGSRHLPDVVEHSNGAEKRLLENLVSNMPLLHWDVEYSPNDFGQSFADNFAYMEMMGTRGHFDSSEMSGGFLLMGPNLHYPVHRHVAEELCILLSDGSYWMHDGGPFEERNTGDFIVHESNEDHAIETPAKPMVFLYLWRGGDLAQKPEF